MLNRREFLGGCAVAALAAPPPRRVLIESGPGGGFRRRLAERELLRGLDRLGFSARLADRGAEPAADELSAALRVVPSRFRNAESYSVAQADGRLLFEAAGEQALLYAVFDFLERQGAFFGIDGESYPLDPPPALAMPPPDRPWSATPRFAVRGLLPWPDFLNCITVYNPENFRAYFEAMLRMRFNTFGMHVYTGANQWAESYLSFEFAGAGHLAFLDTTASHRWGYLPQRTSRFPMGAAEFYDSEVFGSDSTRLVRDPWEAAERARRLLRDALAYAARLGIRTGIGFEPYQIPDEIWRALPPEVKPVQMPDRRSQGPRFDIESRTARDLLETRLAQLLEAYPNIDHLWLWEDEQMNWESRQKGVPLSATPFLQAHDFLRRHAPKKRLVLAGWGGVARHFESLHQRLPGDIIFSCLSDSLGWDPVHESFGKLEGRERWPIPWLEDDPGMWQPQLHVHRFQRDLDQAAEYGCQGLLGIHWRHRIVDPTAGYQARFSWDARVTPTDSYAAYARTQAVGPRAGRLAQILLETDRGRKLLSTFTGEVKDGHAVTQQFSGDYSEAFTFWSNYEPKAEVVASQKQVAEALRMLAEAAATPLERERLGYLAGQVGFQVPYTQSWILAHRIQEVLKAAAELKKAGQIEEARGKVRAEAVPLWLKLAPEVRAVMLQFQSIISTRNDLGQLASMHNKFVRLALVRLRLSLKEYLGELPPEVDEAYTRTTLPDPAAPARLIVPTRPTLLGRGERVSLTIIAPGANGPASVTLYTRARGATEWQPWPAEFVARRTYRAALGPFATGAALVEYYVAAGKLNAPPGAPRSTWAVTLI